EQSEANVRAGVERPGGRAEALVGDEADESDGREEEESQDPGDGHLLEHRQAPLLGGPRREPALEEIVQPERPAGGGGVGREQQQREHNRLLDAEQGRAAGEQEIEAQEESSERREARGEPEQERRADGDLPERHQDREDPGVRDRDLRQERDVEGIARPGGPGEERLLELSAAEAGGGFVQAVLQEETAGVQPGRHPLERRTVVLDAPLQETSGPP